MTDGQRLKRPRGKHAATKKKDGVAAPQYRYLQIQELQQLRNYLFQSGRAVSSIYAGRHSSPERGRSVEFSDYREYFPGDPIADVDWRVFARSDRMFVKVFEDQSELAVNLLIDASASMAYAGDSKLSKYDYACQLGAAVSFLIINQQDRVGFGLAQDGLQGFCPPRRSFQHLHQMLKGMERFQPAGKASLPAAVRSMADQTRGRGILMLISDLHDDLTETLQALSLFAHRGSEVIVFHVLHRDEVELPDMSAAVFEDSESGMHVRLNVEDIREQYTEAVQEHLETSVRAVISRGMSYHRAISDEPYHDALIRFLNRNRRRHR